MELRAHKTDLERHAKRQIHINNIKKTTPLENKQRTLDASISTVTSNENKKAEIKLAAYIATHGSIKSVDHLSDLLKCLANKDSAVENIKLHRTKCSMIIKNVIAESLKEELLEHIGDSNYSLIIDESTDISIMKYLCLCIRYFSTRFNKIITQFLGLCAVSRCTSEILADTIQEYLLKFGLKITNLIGLGTDGANNLCGNRHSVYTILKKKSPKLELVKCIAHSLHLCASKAAETLPSSLEFLCKEVNDIFKG